MHTTNTRAKNSSELMNKLKMAIRLKWGKYSITRSIEEAKFLFNKLDKDHDGYLSKEEFNMYLLNIGLELTSPECSVLFKEFNVSGVFWNEGFINFKEFSTCLQYKLNNDRLNAIKRVFDKYDVNFKGLISLNDVLQCSNQVIDKDKIYDEVYHIVTSIHGKQTNKRCVTFHEFLDYYSNISDAIHSDARFLYILSLLSKSHVGSDPNKHLYF